MMCFDLLRDMGYKQIIIRCLQGNKSENFYKAMGGKVLASEVLNVGGIDIIENVYKFYI